MFENIAQDTTSSATALTRLAAVELARVAESSTARDPGSFWEELVDACRGLIEAKREMASIVNLASRALTAAERIVLSGLPPDAARRAVLAECDSVSEFGESLLEDLGAEGAGLVPSGGTVATMSSSESVRAVLAAAVGSATDFEVLLSESRPGLEGIDLARALGEIGIRSTVVTDAALPRLVGRASLVLVGADSISENDFVNKIGTYPLALAANESAVPCYVAALLDKLIHEAVRGEPGRLWDAKEIIENPPPGIAVENRYFETIPLSLVRGIVTESGVVRSADVPAKLRARPIAPALLSLLFPRSEERRPHPTTPAAGEESGT